MAAVLTITLPIFLLIGLGYLLGRTGLFAPDQFRTMGKLVINVALPALVFRSLANSPVAQVLNPRFIGAYALGSLAMLALGIAIGLFLRRRSLTISAIRSLGMSNSNSAFVGYPVALQILGPPAGVALALCAVVENLIIIPTALAVCEIGRGSGGHWRATLGRTLLSLARQPLIAAIILGAVVAATGLHLPQPVAKAVEMIAGASAPVALLVIGGALVGLQVQGLLSTVVIIAVGKLILHPLVILGTMTLFQVQDPTLRTAGLIFAAAPMMSVLPIWAQRYGDEGPCAAALLGVTVASFFSMSLWLWLIAQYGGGLP